MSSQSPKLAIIAIFGLLAAGVVVFALNRSTEQSAGQGAESGEGAAGNQAGAGQAGGGGQSAAKVTIEFLYSTEKKAWIEESLVAFTKKHPEIAVKLQGKGSLSAVRDILDGKARPTVWSPADHVALNLLADDWFQKERKKLFPDSGDQAPQPLVLTPLVYVSWEDRGKVLTADSPEQYISWGRLRTVLTAREGWKSIGGPAEWGFIKLGHTNPTRSNSGLQALLLMAYEFHDRTNGLEVSHVVDSKFQEFFESIEKAVPKFGDSTGPFMKDMILFGPSKYDIIVTYESLAIEQLKNAQGRWGNLRVYYPQNTMWSSHPAALLDAPWVTPEQKAAGRTFIEFLRAPEQQRSALRYGYRPSDPSIPILGAEADNPFNAAKAHGVEVNVPTAVDPPPGPVINNMMELWSRRVGRD